MMWYEFGLSLVLLIGYCAMNAVLLAAVWYLLVRADPVRSFQEVVLKSLLSIAIVLGLSSLIGRMFCWTASLAQCLACICPVMSGKSLGHISIGGMLFFLLSGIFVQLTLIAIPVRLSRLLFVLTVIATNVTAILLVLGLSAILI